ncbi:MAG: hypothetical protein J0L70_23135 [Leptolyngbya sp. UWPOB_LEPTO1]|uniref:hypothetical protein n=1 Tax=Leptolyngbya sp. UWPOB_LEPTO1 TaxID=2815653 RepID=UPI001ACD5197|nr:hypothetical protein [Leptolyngbya sp. UWPOB_LEPTO1]MBN8563435.1 hypothetical protein [Leptolyngbya sp. UWPOB_LEPTO1]
MSLHKQLYLYARNLGLGLLLFSATVGGSQLFIKAGKQHQTDVKTAEIEQRAQIAEKQADAQDREAKAFQKADQLNIDRLIVGNLSREQIKADNPAWKNHPTQTRLIFDKFERCAGIWRDRKFTPDTTVCNNPDHPLLK